MIIYYIILFFLGVITGILISLFIINVGYSNDVYEYYNEGFLDGYNEKTQEILKEKEVCL